MCPQTTKSPGQVAGGLAEVPTVGEPRINEMAGGPKVGRAGEATFRVSSYSASDTSSLWLSSAEKP